MGYMGVPWLLGVCFLFLQTRADARDVDAAPFFKSTTPEDAVLIQLGPDDMLVFKESDGPLVLNGRRLVLSAPNVRVEGARAEIISFRSDDTPAGFAEPAGRGTDVADGGKGCQDGGGGADAGKGQTGAIGARGKDVPPALVQLSAVDGGLLIISLRGQKGGPGQDGGRGGVGGRGGPGHDRSCSGKCRRPGNGGPGGQAGMGGEGGHGGIGGAGAQVETNLRTLELVKAKQLELIFEGGDGGNGGKEGHPGEPGAGGKAGNGNACGGGGAMGLGGAPNLKGALGPAGLVGESGMLVCADCGGTEFEVFKGESRFYFVPAGMERKITLNVSRPKISRVLSEKTEIACYRGVRTKDKWLKFGSAKIKVGTQSIPLLEPPFANQECSAAPSTDSGVRPIDYTLSVKAPPQDAVIVVVSPATAPDSRAGICALYQHCKN